MKTSLETLDGLKRSLTVELPIEIFRQKTDAILRKMASQVNIDGFRKGKVPLSILRQKFGDHAGSDAVNEIVSPTKISLGPDKLIVGGSTTKQLACVAAKVLKASYWLSCKVNPT